MAWSLEVFDNTLTTTESLWTFIGGPVTADDIIVVSVTARDDSADLTGCTITGYTVMGDWAALNPGTIFFYKVSDGTETDITVEAPGEAVIEIDIFLRACRYDEAISVDQTSTNAHSTFGSTIDVNDLLGENTGEPSLHMSVVMARGDSGGTFTNMGFTAGAGALLLSTEVARAAEDHIQSDTGGDTDGHASSAVLWTVPVNGVVGSVFIVMAVASIYFNLGAAEEEVVTGVRLSLNKPRFVYAELPYQLHTRML